jgi:hypothetical protein
MTLAFAFVRGIDAARRSTRRCAGSEKKTTATHERCRKRKDERESL